MKLEIELNAEPPPLQRILVLADLTLGAKNALWRAALLAKESGASIHALHVVQVARAVAPAQAFLEQICGAIQERLGVGSVIEVVVGHLPREVARAAHEAGLLVLPGRRSDTLKERIAGAARQRILRLSRIPALVVHRPAIPPRGAVSLGAGYGRVLVSVGISREGAGVIATACRFAGDRKMEVFHVVSARKEARPQPVAVDPDVLRPTEVDRAREGLHALIEAAGAAQHGAVAAVGFGRAAASVVSRAHAIGADLVVVGARRRGFFTDYVRTDISQQIVANSRSDVLVVPMRWRAAPSTAT